MPAIKKDFGHYSVEVVRNLYIKIKCNKTGLENKFKLGDSAEYDSYNLSYYGTIMGITDKTVIIVCRHDMIAHRRNEPVHRKRVKLENFCWRNIKFDLDEVQKRNTETSHSI
jgi:hypothetical protein